MCKFFIKSLLRDCIFHLHVLQGPRQPEITIFCFILGGTILVAPFSGLPDGNKGLVKGNICVSKYEPAILIGFHLKPNYSAILIFSETIVFVMVFQGSASQTIVFAMVLQGSASGTEQSKNGDVGGRVVGGREAKT